MPVVIAVVDYRKGNLASVTRGLADAGYDARVTDSADDIRAADGIVLPGVGAFADAMDTMTELGQADAIRERVTEGVPFLGICLGLHLMMEYGDEGCAQGERREGLALACGHVERVAATDAAGTRYKVPHVGWNSVYYARLADVGGDAGGEAAGGGLSDGETAAGGDGVAGGPSGGAAADVPGEFASTCPLFRGVPDGSWFYFTHSYRALPSCADDIIATTTHARRFVVAIQHGNAFGVQFHPEKSSALGLKVLANFGRVVRGAS